MALSSWSYRLPEKQRPAGPEIRGDAGACEWMARETGDQGLAVGVETGRPILSWLYSYSLGIALALLFIISFALHRSASLAAANAEALRHGGEVQSLGGYLMNAQMWFESFQNWQSEFMSTAVLVVLSIFLRHKGSPESKPAGAANSDTGA